MNRVFRTMLLTVGTVALIHAAPTCSTTSNITNLNNGGLGCDIIGLNFNNFVLTTTGAGSNGPDAVFQIDVLPTFDNVTFNVNNNQGSGANVQTQTLTFTVNLAAANKANGIFGASSSNGGTTSPNTTIREVVCVGAIDPTTGVCTGALLWDNTNNGGTSSSKSFLPVTAVSVWRQSTTPAGATITGGSFDFSTPEPISVLLVGCGLLGIGAVRRRNG